MVTLAYYRGVVGALVVYDISHRLTFDNVTRWLAKLKMHAESNVVKILVGNKSDLDHIREVPVQDGRKLAESRGLFLIETSALYNTNVMLVFQIVVREYEKNECQEA